MSTHVRHGWRWVRGLLISLAVVATSVAQAGQWMVWSTSRTTPSFSLTDLDGKNWNLQDLRGRVVVLNFWASWCEPCVTEMPWLAELAASYGGSRVVVLAVNYMESEAKVRRFLVNSELTVPVILDRDATLSKSWIKPLFPTSVVIGPDGRARYTVIGEHNWASSHSRQKIEGLLLESTPSGKT